MPKTPRSEHEDQPHRSTESIEPPDPDERLKELQHELNQHNSRIAHLTSQRDALNADITDLQATVAEVKATVTNYGSVHKDLEARLHALRYFYEQKAKMVHAAIGDKKGPIDELIREFDSETDKMQERLTELGEAQSAAQAESQEAAKVEAERQQDYDEKKQYQQQVTAKLIDMEALRTEITQSDDNTDVASMYFLLLECRHELEGTHAMSQHQLSVELRERLAELEAAKERARAKAHALSTVQEEYTAHKTALDTRRSGRRAKLLAEVQAKFPVPASSSPASGTATPGASSPASGPSGSTPATPGVATPSTATTPTQASQKK